VRAIISPHAGYVFSGKVAASVFNQIDGTKTYENIFIIASSHQEHFTGASVYCDGDYIMPYGKVSVNTDVSMLLVDRHPDLFTSNPKSHLKEHSIEVQLPFLDHVMQTEYCIVPIIIGGSDKNTCIKLANALKPWFNQDNLFIISTDFSHYPNESNARKTDYLTKEAIISNEPDKLLTAVRENMLSGTPGLVTSLCGWTSVLTLMYLTYQDDNLEYKDILYMNSGDSKLYGEKNRVVGYWGIAVSQKKIVKEFNITQSDKKELLKIAREAINEAVKFGKTSKPDASGFSNSLKTNCGAFVTLHLNKRLRGCIGRLIGDIPLYKMVQEMAVSSALHDYRFTPLRVDEIDKIDIEISVLSPLIKIKNPNEIQLGKHGIMIEKGRRSGVFLPQVATETGWNLDEFLGHCARDKAGIGWDGWLSADIYIFTATVFGEIVN
jgi:AmmeMemoRadiSam system protein B/AmmeMemoRadiSam system protein A